jgi:cell division protein FtsB
MTTRKRQAKYKLRQRAVSCFFTVIMAYFAYHGFFSSRSFFSMVRLNGEIEQARTELKQIKHDRKDLESRVALVAANNVDADLLDEQSRKMLGLGKKTDFIVLIDEN